MNMNKELKYGDVVAEGKTKVITYVGDGLGLVQSKDDITAGDGAKHDVFEGKGRLANTITCNVFDLLKHFGVPLAYMRPDEEVDAFFAEIVDMIPVEIVVRNQAFGSYLKRNSNLIPNMVLPMPVVEFFYKTTDRNFFGMTLPCDDPLMLLSDDGVVITLHHPGEHVDHERPLLQIVHSQMTVETRRELHAQLKVCKDLALKVNGHLKHAWETQGGCLIDFKIECGINANGEVVVADVIDFDSWRVMLHGKPLSKQIYRDGGSDEDVMHAMRLTAQVTKGFYY